MSKIDCGEGATPCRCDKFSGCGHLSSWHQVYERWLARCLVPGCDCTHMDVCNCVDGDGDSEGDKRIAQSLGISVEEAECLKN